MTDKLTLRLPNGFIDKAGTLHREVELRSLTGKVEEQAAQSSDPVNLVLGHCLERVGTITPAPPDVVAGLSETDRSYLLLEIQKKTFGDRVQGRVSCPGSGCGETVDIDFSIQALILGGVFEGEAGAELELEVHCPECGEVFNFPFRPPVFFLGQLSAGLPLLYDDVHTLAYHYHWSESEILSLPYEKRRMYLEMLADELPRGTMPMHPIDRIEDPRDGQDGQAMPRGAGGLFARDTSSQTGDSPLPPAGDNSEARPGNLPGEPRGAGDLFAQGTSSQTGDSPADRHAARGPSLHGPGDFLSDTHHLKPHANSGDSPLPPAGDNSAARPGNLPGGPRGAGGLIAGPMGFPAQDTLSQTGDSPPPPPADEAIIESMVIENRPPESTPVTELQLPGSVERPPRGEIYPPPAARGPYNAERESSNAAGQGADKTSHPPRETPETAGTPFYTDSRSPVPSAFWARSYLGRFHLKTLR